MRRRPRAFTLVELMVVVALVGVIASVAVLSLRRSRSTGDTDAWANTLRNMATQARARAISTKQIYMMDLRSSTTVVSAQWCQVTVDTSTCTTTGCPTVPTTCPNSATGAENGDIVFAPADAKIDSTYAGMDVWAPGTTYANVSHTTTLPDQIYFGTAGTVDAAFTNVFQGIGTGFTIYVRASNNTPGSITANSANQMRRRIVIYGPSGRARVLDNWQ